MTVEELQKALDKCPKWEKEFYLEELHDYASECHEWFEVLSGN